MWKQAQSTSKASQPERASEAAEQASTAVLAVESYYSIQLPIAADQAPSQASKHQLLPGTHTRGPSFTQTLTPNPVTTTTAPAVVYLQPPGCPTPHCCDGAEWPVARCPTNVTGPFILLRLSLLLLLLLLPSLARSHLIVLGVPLRQQQ